MIEEFTGTSYLTSSIRGNVRWAAAELYDIPESDGDDSQVSLSVECDIYSFGSIILQVNSLSSGPKEPLLTLQML